MKNLLIVISVGALIFSQKIFEPGIISTNNAQEYGITFINNDWLCFTRQGKNQKKTLYFSYKKDNMWTMATIAPFSGEFDDEYPGFDAINQRLYFSSKRSFNDEKVKGNDLWYSELKNGKWSEAKHLEGVLSGPGIESGASAYGDIIYFHSDRSGRGMNSVDIYSANLSNPNQSANKLLINSNVVDGEPHIFNNGNAMLFMSAGHSSIGRSDIFLSVKKDDNWSTPLALIEVNSKYWDYTPALSPDMKYLFFTRIVDKKTNIYRMATSKISKLAKFLD